MNTGIDAERGQTQFDYEQDGNKRIIKVIGVGGGGGNAVTTMFRNEHIEGVTFLLCNTDEQALRNSSVVDKVTLGPQTTKGLGAGNKPDVARRAAEESAEVIKERLTADDTEMVFITAGMGGGTGTGAAPVVGRIAREAGKLTIGIVTIPFKFEGRPKILQALQGVRQLQDNVDALLVVNNERLVEIHGKKTMRESFKLADDTLSNAAKSISDIINQYGHINLDFADVKTTLKDSGVAVISSGRGTGNSRLKVAIQQALESPLLNNNSILKSRRLMLAVYSSEKQELLTEEIETLTEFTSSIDTEFESKLGFYIDPDLADGEVKVTILASGFGYEDTYRSIEGSSNTMTPQEQANKRAEDDKQIEHYYGKDKLGHGLRVRRPLILKLEELDNENLIQIAEDSPAFNRDLRLFEELRRRNQNDLSTSTDAKVIGEANSSYLIGKGLDNSETIYF